ncbi:hypothetical protein FA09DRAFT_360339 [Tilletiopsis washingtonensis]|uniref:C2H2-type domain-containing protein n=1 Tax=Tilletiopsis washingtonensis TaxID=58919 RepID=A0A316ZC91_9BASI|nr:hypothetical protein FA09DRAFT_360339 [Tilletiopsis washingtonensis]PWN98634.1 hypothetical protein FA09DRAFT_360339 [Tilletiopsis washingtonensis]
MDPLPLYGAPPLLPHSAKATSASPTLAALTRHPSPFDSPWDASVSSPASSRDFGSPALFDFDAAPGSPNGTATLPGSDAAAADDFAWLAGVDLFGAAGADVPATLQASAAAPADRQSELSHEVQSLLSAQCGLPQDFSFDTTLSTRGHNALLTVASRGVSRSSSASSLLAPTPTSTAPRSPSPANSQDSTIASLAAAFVREYARTHESADTAVLLRALAVAGIEVSMHTVEDILSAYAAGAPSPTLRSATQSRSPSVASFSSSKADSLSASVTDWPAPQSWTTLDAQSVLSSSAHSPLGDDAAAAVTTIGGERAPASGKARSSLHTTHKDITVGGRSSQPLLSTRGSGAARRFTCSVCSKVFERAYNARTHMTTHLSADARERPFVCPCACGKDFARKHDAMRHYRSVHLRKGEAVDEEAVSRAVQGHANPTAGEMMEET